MKEQRNPIDPGLFLKEAIAPEVIAFNQVVEETLAKFPRLDQVPLEETRQSRAEGRMLTGEVVPIYRSALADNVLVNTGQRDIEIRVFRPKQIKGVYLHIHGGGWVFGSYDLQDDWLEDIATSCQVAVVSVQYRLAPEHPFPAGADDCEAVAAWLVENAMKEFGTDRIMGGGESAGAHLSAVTCIRMREKHQYSGFKGAVLTYGIHDVGLTPSVVNWGERNLIISTPTMKWFADLFVPDASQRRTADVSPLYADLDQFPPSLLTAGTWDPLLDDSLFMHAKLVSLGRQSELVLYPGGIHGFDIVDTPVISKQARERIKSFIMSS